MSFPIIIKSSKTKDKHLDATLSWNCLELDDWYNLISFSCDDEVYIKFNEMDSETIMLLSTLVYNYFYNTKRIYYKAVSKATKLHVYYDKIEV